MKTILFQGDSITDAGRNREDPESLGTGYPLLVAAKLGYEYPGEYKFVNRGVSGNKSVDVAARIKEDIIDVAPDYMSLMVGVNDVWHGIDYNWWATCDDLDRSLREIIEKTREACPGVKIYSTGGTYTKVREILGDAADGTLVAVSDLATLREPKFEISPTVDASRNVNVEPTPAPLIAPVVALCSLTMSVPTLLTDVEPTKRPTFAELPAPPMSTSTSQT